MTRGGFRIASQQDIPHVHKERAPISKACMLHPNLCMTHAANRGRATCLRVEWRHHQRLALAHGDRSQTLQRRRLAVGQHPQVVQHACALPRPLHCVARRLGRLVRRLEPLEVMGCAPGVARPVRMLARPVARCTSAWSISLRQSTHQLQSLADDRYSWFQEQLLAVSMQLHLCEGVRSRGFGPASSSAGAASCLFLPATYSREWNTDAATRLWLQ